ncbi:unnamed protein product [marine sediment metagenome]|uniref:Uncharacterized protein n=1 Tax=marine sediment metagenome TaxID=412755 RepID=X1LNN0_9ZZZZ
MRECDVGWLLDHPEHYQAFLDVVKDNIKEVQMKRFERMLDVCNCTPDLEFDELCIACQELKETS